MMQTRRMFCGSTLAIAGAGAVAMLWPPELAAHAAMADPIQAHITTEFERLYRTFMAGTMRADDYRAGAINFELWAAHARTRDSELAQQIAEAVRREGRDELVQDGLRVARADRQRRPVPTQVALAAALTRIERGGLPLRLERLAAGMDEMFVVMQRRTNDSAGGTILRTQASLGSAQAGQAVRRVALSQDGDAWSHEAVLYSTLAELSREAPLFESVREAAGLSAALYSKAMESCAGC